MVTSNPVTDQESDALDEKRTPEQREALARLLKSAAEQGVKPLTREDLDAMRGIWPDDENIDDFVADVRHWRSEGLERELP